MNIVINKKITLITAIVATLLLIVVIILLNTTERPIIIDYIIVEQQQITTIENRHTDESNKNKAKETYTIQKKEDDSILSKKNKNNSIVQDKTQINTNKQTDIFEISIKTTNNINTDENQKYYDAVVVQILVNNSWRDSTGETILTFNENEYIAKYKSSITEKEETTTCKYEIIEVIANERIYKIRWIMTDGDGVTYNINDVLLEVIDDDMYSLYSFSLPYARSYQKISKNQEKIDSEKTIEDLQLMNKINSVNKELVGVWKGTVEENINEQSVYWVYEFTENGKYTFDNKETSETGTYELTHDFNNMYHSVVHLKTEYREYKKKLFITNGNKLSFEQSDEPVYIKQ